MALIYPLSLAKWFDALPLASITFDLSVALVASETGGGEILTSAYATRLWGGTCTIATRQHRDAERLAALGRALQAPGATFLATPIHMPAPALVPVLPASPVLNAQQNGREIKIGGLASGDKLSAGEFIGWSYGSSPVRMALHQLVEDATAGVSGVTGWAEVVPPIRDGATNGQAVTLVSPACLARVVPGSWGPPQIGPVIAQGFTFQWGQTLR